MSGSVSSVVILVVVVVGISIKFREKWCAYAARYTAHAVQCGKVEYIALNFSNLVIIQGMQHKRYLRLHRIIVGYINHWLHGLGITQSNKITSFIIKSDIL